MINPVVGRFPAKLLAHRVKMMKAHHMRNSQESEGKNNHGQRLRPSADLEHTTSQINIVMNNYIAHEPAK